MLTRRGFAGCALCLVTGFVASGAEAQNGPGGLKRTIITRMDAPMEGYEAVNVRVDLDAGTLIARHTHPGIELSYVVDGGLELSVDGEGTRTFKAGDEFQVPPRARMVARTVTSRRSCHHLHRRKGQAPCVARLKTGDSNPKPILRRPGRRRRRAGYGLKISLNAGRPAMIRISSLVTALALFVTIPASAQDKKPAQAPAQSARSKGACRANCEAQYNQDKECQPGVSAMHSPCELYNQCLSDCD